MSDIVKNFSIQDIEVDKESDNKDFAEVEIYAFAEGGNTHNNPISKEVLERDAFTFKGKFLTAKFDRFTNDVKAHETDEVIIGYVDPTADIEFKTKEVDGVEKEFVVVKGLLSKIYANDVYEMFKENNERTVSCEFSCSTFYDEDENGTPLSENGEKMFGEENPILGYDIHSITILGLSYRPSIRGTEIKVKKFAENNFKQVLDKNKDKEESMKDKKEFSAVDIGYLYGRVYDILETKYPNEKDGYGSIYRIYNIYEENGNKFALIYKNNEDSKYKLNIFIDDDEIKLSDEITKVEIDIVETDKVKEFSSDGIDKKYLEFVKEEDKKEEDIVMEENKDKESQCSEVEDENKKMANEENEPKECEDKNKECVDKTKECSETTKECEENENDDIDDKDDKKDEKEDKEEKKFSLSEFSDVSLENESDSIKSYIQEKIYSMSANEIVNELVSLKKFEVEQNTKEKEFELNRIMSNVKEDLDTKTFSELQEEGKKLSLNELGGFENKVKAFAYESTKKNRKEDDGIMKFGGVVKEETINAEISADDIFNKYL